jgi:excisionase family DNA binding protein
MPVDEAIARARGIAGDLRRRGELDGADAIEALIRTVGSGEQPRKRLLTSTQAGQRLGVTGQTVKNWVKSRQLAGVRMGGRVLVPDAAVDEYLRRAGASLDLEDLADAEAAALVAEDRLTGHS